MVKRVALFDFDNTVAAGNSIARLLEYDLKKHPFHIFHFLKVGFYYLLYLLKITPFEKAKSAILFPITYMDDQELEYFYDHYVAKHYYAHVVEEMERKKEDDFIVILCTASSESYMRYQKLPVDVVLGTRTQRIGNRETNIVIGKNCKGKEKIQRIQEYLASEDVEIDYDNSFGYSDSNEDIPMLSLVKHKKRVLLKTGEIVEFEK